MDGVIAMKNNIQPRMMRMRQLTEYLNLSRAHLYQRITEGTFPPGRLISPGVRVWNTDSIEAWVDRQMGGA